MRKLLLIGVFACAFSLTWAHGDEKKVASVNTYTQGNGSAVLSKLEKRFYDKNDSLAFAFTYDVANGKQTQSGYKYQFYDKQLRHVSDSTNLAKTYYYYDDAGNIVKKVNWTNYNNPNYPDTKNDSTLYFYTGNKLDSVKISDYSRTKYVYHYKADGKRDYRDTYGVNYSDNYKYEVLSRLHYTYDERGNMVATLNKTINNGTDEAEGGTKNVYVYNESNQLVSDTIVSTYSTVAHKYEYDADGMLASCTHFNLNTANNTWKEGNKEEYVYGAYNSAKVVENLKATQSADEPSTVVLSFDKPSATEGLDGYKVVKDGVLADDIIKGENSISLPLQTRGKHSYMILPVYNSLEGNVSEKAEINIDFEIPAPQNLYLYSKEYKGDESFGNWDVVLKWDAPKPCAYTLKGYRYEIGTTNGETADSVRTAKFTDYGWDGEVTTVNVYAVYNVGMSDPVSVSYNNKDHADQITVHFHNKKADITDKNGAITEKRHYLYVPVYDDYNVGENLYATIVESADGKPQYRVSADGKETRKWNEKLWKWDDYKKTENISNASGYDSLTVESIYTDGKWKPMSKLIVNRDKDNKVIDYTKIEYQGTDSTVVRYTRFEEHAGKYNALSAQIDSLYSEDNMLTGKIERIVKGYDKNNKLQYSSVTSYTYANGNMIPKSKMENTFDSDWTLNKTAWFEYKNEEWTVDSVANYNYAASKEYSRTHTPEGDFVCDVDDADNPMVTWNEPVRKDGLTSYDLYLDDIVIDSVAADVLTYSLKDAKIPESAKGDHSLRVMAKYNNDENCLSQAVEISIVSVATGIENITNEANNESFEVYSLDGKRIPKGMLRNMQNHIVIVKTTHGDGSIKCRKLLLK